MTEKLRKFCNTYEIKVLNDQKRYARYTRIQDYFVDPAQANVINCHSIYDTEKLYTVEIPESRLERLANIDHMVFNGQQSPHAREMFETLMDKEYEEQLIRDSNPAVKKAYEHYSLLLHLAKNG